MLRAALVLTVVVCVPGAAYAAAGPVAASGAVLLLQVVTTAMQGYFTSKIPPMQRQLDRHANQLTSHDERMDMIERGQILR
jgi:hypothetical protein